jgi:hypothetical protein
MPFSLITCVSAPEWLEFRRHQVLLVCIMGPWIPYMNDMGHKNTLAVLYFVILPLKLVMVRYLKKRAGLVKVFSLELL